MKVDKSAPRTKVSFPGSNYASMDRVGKKGVGLENTQSIPMLEGSPGKGVKPSPLYKGAPKGVVGMVAKKTMKILR